MGVDLFAMVFGLGFVLSFGYWCTNFLVVQRAMAAKNMTAARRTPLIAAVPKMLFPALVILPGMIAVGAGLHAGKDGYRLPAEAHQELREHRRRREDDGHREPRRPGRLRQGERRRWA